MAPLTHSKRISSKLSYKASNEHFQSSILLWENKCNDHTEIHDVVSKQPVGEATQTTIFTGMSAVYFKLSKYI